MLPRPHESTRSTEHPERTALWREHHLSRWNRRGLLLERDLGRQKQESHPTIRHCFRKRKRGTVLWEYDSHSKT